MRFAIAHGFAVLGTMGHIGAYRAATARWRAARRRVRHPWFAPDFLVLMALGLDAGHIAQRGLALMRRALRRVVE